MMSQRSGGWPLTMFLTPEQEPFFGGTYFPKTPRYGLPGFPDLLLRVAQFYHSDRAEIARQSKAILDGFERMQPANPAHHSEFSRSPIDLALENLAASFDARYGGFGAAPKSRYTRGVLAKYMKLVSTASLGAITDGDL